MTDNPIRLPDYQVHQIIELVVLWKQVLFAVYKPAEVHLTKSQSA